MVETTILPAEMSISLTRPEFKSADLDVTALLPSIHIGSHHHWPIQMDRWEQLANTRILDQR
jgi:hypothetical protein